MSGYSSSGSATSQDTCALILILGMKGAGKSEFLNATTGTDDDDGTRNIPPQHVDTSADLAVRLRYHPVNGWPCCFVDMPDLDADACADAHVDVVGRARGWLEDAYEKHMYPDGIIFLHSATTALQPGVLDQLEAVCAAEEMKGVMFVSTGWNGLGPKKLREVELRQQEMEVALRARMNVGGPRTARFDGTALSARQIVSRILSTREIGREARRRAQVRSAGGGRFLPPVLRWGLIGLVLWIVLIGIWNAGPVVRRYADEFDRMAGLAGGDLEAAAASMTRLLGGGGDAGEMVGGYEEGNADGKADGRMQNLELGVLGYGCDNDGGNEACTVKLDDMEELELEPEPEPEEVVQEVREPEAAADALHEKPARVNNGSWSWETGIAGHSGEKMLFALVVGIVTGLVHEYYLGSFGGRD